MDKKDGGTIDLESLQQVRDYFADRQDAEHRDGETFPTPNEEMRLLGTLDSVLAELTARRARAAEVEALVAALREAMEWNWLDVDARPSTIADLCDKALLPFTGAKP